MVAKLFTKTLLFRENSVFFATKVNFLSPPPTSGGTRLRDDLSHNTLQVLRKLYGQASSSFLAIAFSEVKKAPKTGKNAKFLLYFPLQIDISTFVGLRNYTDPM